MIKKPNILVVGSFVMDLIVSCERFPSSGETVIGNGFSTAPGGKGANQAVQIARLGADVTMVGKVGDDLYGEKLLEFAKSSGVDVSRVAVTKEVPTAIGNVQIEENLGKKANRIIVVPGANYKISPEDIMFLKDEISKYDMVILQLEIPLEIDEMIINIAYEMSVPVMLNPAPSAELPKSLLRKLTYISPNEHESADITGITIQDEDSLRHSIEALNGLGTKNVVITLGDKGAAYGNFDGFITSPCVDAGDVKDPTGAGDSFIAAFCTAVCMGVSTERALKFANYTAAITVSRMGAQPSLPYISEVIELMKAHGVETKEFEVLI